MQHEVTLGECKKKRDATLLACLEKNSRINNGNNSRFLIQKHLTFVDRAASATFCLIFVKSFYQNIFF